LVEFKPAAHDVTIADLACLSFLHLAEVCLAKLDELLRRMYLGHFQCFQQINRVLFFLRSDEGNGSALIPPSSCPSNAVDVILKMIGTLEIDYQHDRADI
jgi:hypothetical protein